MVMFCIYVLCITIGGIIGNEYFDNNIIIGAIIGFIVAFIIHCIKLGASGESFGDAFDTFDSGDFGD